MSRDDGCRCEGRFPLLSVLASWHLLGEVTVPADYAGPRLEQDEDGTSKITLEFVRAMMQWFKDGKALPKRYVWEIIMGAYDIFRQEETLVNIPIPDGVTCDVIGDVHGEHLCGQWTRRVRHIDPDFRPVL
jgi:hypothetical protein